MGNLMIFLRFSGIVSVRLRLRKAEHLNRAGRFAQAFNLLAPLARHGVADAQLRIGRAYLEGRGVPHSFAEGLRWCERAAHSGSTEAQTLTASLLLSAYSNLPTGLASSVSKIGASSEKEPANFETAIYWAQTAADAGCADAKALLAYFHANGPEKMRDQDRSAMLYQESAYGGSPQGALGHGLILLSAAQDYEMRQAAVTWITKAADANLPFAFHLLGIAKEHGLGTSKDLPEAITYYRKAAERSIVAAQARLGDALFKGVGVPQNIVEGETWLRRAALAGNAASAYTVGSVYAAAGVLPPNYLEASNWYVIAARLGHADAARALGKLYNEGGHGLARDRGRAASWLCHSAQANDVAIWAELAALILSGAGDKNVRDRTKQWYANVAENGDSVAAFTLGLLLLSETGLAREPARAAELLCRAAETIVDAQFIYGRMLCEGDGIAKNMVAGRAVLSRAAAVGHVEAKVLLAEMMLNGRGGPKDAAAAMVLFQNAADAGHVGALYATGVLHCGVNGVKPDEQRATQMFKLAADRGHAFAQLALGRFFLHGVAGERDVKQARHWLHKASVQGVKEAISDLESSANAA